MLNGTNIRWTDDEMFGAIFCSDCQPTEATQFLERDKAKPSTGGNAITREKVRCSIKWNKSHDK